MPVRPSVAAPPLAIAALVLASAAACPGRTGDSAVADETEPGPPHAELATPTAPLTAPTVGERVPWEFIDRIATAPIPLLSGGEIGVGAALCGACHTDIHAEWQQSTHAAAMRDPQFIAELGKPDAPRWLCVSCHAPLVNQHETRYTLDTPLRGVSEHSVGEPASEPNPHFDAALAAEAVTCATCHVRVADDGRGTILGSRGDTTAPHRVTVDAPALRNVCVRCHSPGEGFVTPTFPCWFETEDELRDGPHAGTDCVDCHMPSAHRPLALGGPPRDTRHHFWVGGGVPKSFDAYDGLLARGWQPGLDFATSMPRHTAGGIDFTLRIDNARAGHAVPTADPERHLRVHARALAADGTTLAHATAHIGQEWDWGDAAAGRPARRLSDNRIAPGETREVPLRLELSPEALERANAVEVEVLHVRLSPENLAYARNTPIDDALARVHRPDAAHAVANLAELYPTLSWVFHERWALTDGVPSAPADRASLDALIERSRALAGADDATLRAVVHGEGNAD